MKTMELQDRTEFYQEPSLATAALSQQGICRELLEEIQESIANVTGIAFVTVDYKGDVITETTHFCEYCKSVRENPTSALLCRLSDASGAIIAATTKEASIYICPCGLLEMAIPIIVDGQYIGGFIGGQIRCHDVPDNIMRLSKNMVPGGQALIQQDIYSVDESMLSDIKVYRYSEVQSIVKLVELIINQLTNHELISNRNKQENLKKIDILSKELEAAEEKAFHLYVELEQYKRYVAALHDCELLSVMSNLAILEGANDTHHAITRYARIMGATQELSFLSTINDECERINHYIQLMNRSENLHITWCTVLEPESLHCSFPSYVGFHYVQILIQILKRQGATDVSIHWTTEVKMDCVCLVIEDSSMICDESASYGRDLDIAIDMLEKSIKSHYGCKASFHIHQKVEGGIQLLIEYPTITGEGAVYGKSISS